MRFRRYQVRSVVVARKCHAVHSSHETTLNAFNALRRDKKRFGKNAGARFVYDGHLSKRVARPCD